MHNGSSFSCSEAIEVAKYNQTMLKIHPVWRKLSKIEPVFFPFVYPWDDVEALEMVSRRRSRGC